MLIVGAICRHSSNSVPRSSSAVAWLPARSRHDLGDGLDVPVGRAALDCARCAGSQMTSGSSSVVDPAGRRDAVSFLGGPHARPSLSVRRWAQMRASARTSARTFSRFVHGAPIAWDDVLDAALDLQAAETATATSGRATRSGVRVSNHQPRLSSILPCFRPLWRLSSRPSAVSTDDRVMRRYRPSVSTGTGKAPLVDEAVRLVTANAGCASSCGDVDGRRPGPDVVRRRHGTHTAVIALRR
jgi:hypothetical protein